MQGGGEESGSNVGGGVVVGGGWGRRIAVLTHMDGVGGTDG